MRIVSTQCLIVVTWVLASTAGAATRTWGVSGPADWATGSNWNGGNAPGSGDAAGINNAGTAVVSSAVSVADVGLGWPTGNSNAGFLQITTGGSFTVNGGDLDVGVRSAGTSSVFTLSDGSATMTTGSLIIGDESGSRGSVFVSGGTLSVGGKLRVGSQGRASFNVQGSAGTINVAGDLTTRENDNGQATSVSFALDNGGASAIHVGGSTTIGGGGTGTPLVITMTNFAPQADVVLIDSSVTSPLISGNFTRPIVGSPLLLDGDAIDVAFGEFWTYHYIIDYDYGANDNDVALVFGSVTATPEPGTAGVMLLGGACLCVRRRRRRAYQP